MQPIPHFPWRSALLALLVTLMSAMSAHALSTIHRDFAELVDLAEVILVGTVHDKQSVWLDPVQQQGIVTRITLSQIELLKSNEADVGDSYTLEIAGGQIGPYLEWIADFPKLRLGERYVLFIRGNQRQLFPVVGIAQGVLEIKVDANGIARVYTYDKKPLTTTSEIGAPEKALLGAAALSLDTLKNTISAQIETNDRAFR
jgi:hypothetical protein